MLNPGTVSWEWIARGHQSSKFLVHNLSVSVLLLLKTRFLSFSLLPVGRKLKRRGLFELPAGSYKETTIKVINTFFGLHQAQVSGTAVMSQS